MGNIDRTLEILTEKKGEDVMDVLEDHLRLSRQQFSAIDNLLVRCKSPADELKLVVKVLAEHVSLTRLREAVKDVRERCGLNIRTGDVLDAVVHEEPQDVREVEKHVIKIFGRDWRTLR